MVKSKFFNSKILLFGEYTVTLGSDALAVPFDHFKGYWNFSANATESNANLQQLYNYLQKESKLSDLFDMKNLANDIEDGLFFESSIPTGYGLGSSGALVAALYDKYATDKILDSNSLKSIFATIENCFHGASSGIDPLVSYLNEPILIRNKIEIIPVQCDVKRNGFFMIDSGISRKTAPFVHIFNNKMNENADFRTNVEVLKSVNRQIISNLINKENIKTEFEIISKIQSTHFGEMIPEKLKPVWQNGLESRQYFLKLCGAGGGGMFLGWSEDSDFLSQTLADTTLTVFHL